MLQINVPHLSLVEQRAQKLNTPVEIQSHHTSKYEQETKDNPFSNQHAPFSSSRLSLLTFAEFTLHTRPKWRKQAPPTKLCALFWGFFLRSRYQQWNGDNKATTFFFLWEWRTTLLFTFSCDDSVCSINIAGVAVGEKPAKCKPSWVLWIWTFCLF